MPFILNDAFREMLPVEYRSNPVIFTMSNLVTGSLAGFTSILIFQPIFVARTRYNCEVGSKLNKELSGVTNTIMKIYGRDGVKGLYKGFLVNSAQHAVFRGL